MLPEQVKTRGINNPLVLEAMSKVPRHLFVPSEYQESAYADSPLPIGEGQTISQPYIVAFMTEILKLSKQDKVLEIGTGSGYQTAILAELCKQVYSVEIIHTLACGANSLLLDLGYRNIKIKLGDGYEGWPEYAPYDAVVVTCCPTHIPQSLTEQLKERGKIIIPVGKPHSQKLVLLQKINNKVYKQNIFEVRFVPMTKEGGKTY